MYFGYDAWGNLLSISRIAGYSCSNEELLNVTATTKNQISGYTYDSAGNVINDGLGHAYVYNAENQLTSAGGASYIYDGDGKRVEKTTGKLFWYGLNSDPLDETDLAGSTANSAFYEYAFFGGKRIARRDSSNAVIYYFADHLGSARIIASSSGTVLDDSDYYPFGGERVIISSSTNQTYKFTGKKRDLESGLDNFGARYMSSSMGRFMTPDWSAAPMGVPYADFENPQSLNLYSYVKNNPLNSTDTLGHQAQGPPPPEPERPPEEETTEELEFNKELDNAERAVRSRELQRMEDAHAAWEEKQVNGYDDPLTGVCYAPPSGRTANDPPRRDSNGRLKPDPEAEGAEHTQLSTRTSRKQRGNPKYRQKFEFNDKGQPVRRVDHSDHGRARSDPRHTNPHEHDIDPKTQEPGPPKPLGPPPPIS